MVAPDKALPARPDNIIPVVISQLEGLVHRAMAIAKVGRLRGTEMGTEALNVTWYGKRDVSGRAPYTTKKQYLQTECVGKVEKASVGQDPGRAETRNDNLFHPTTHTPRECSS
jgi:hypothetical protein